jgi:A/G-specific adenine glycosylase
MRVKAREATAEGGLALTRERRRAPLQQNLLSWYRKNRRDLPWRRTSDPYAIWLSEVMLQQTTIAVVVPRFTRFLERFPTVESLARASERAVLAEWSGLGYYSRARNLHRAAREITRRGKFPRTHGDLRALPGVGDYTAAAVASIAFGVPAASVDGNVARVLCRLEALAIHANSPKGKQRLRELADSLLSKKSPGDFNQALMELGATVCLPRKPLCSACPLRSVCEGKRRGTPESFPLPRSKKPLRHVHLVAGLAFRNGRLILVEDEHLVKDAGHLTVPLFEEKGSRKKNDRGLLRKEWRTVTGRDVADVQPLGALRHSVLNRRYVVSLYLLRESEQASRGGRHGAPGFLRLVRPTDLVRHARGGLLEKIVALWRRAGSPR